MRPEIIPVGETAGLPRKESAGARASAVGKLCPSCGLCCNGVLFTSVRLEKQDCPDSLKALGFPLQSQGSEWIFPQPCQAFQKGCCSVYAQRPGRCREFHCYLVQQLAGGEITPAEGLREIGDTRRLADRVTGLLAAMGDTDSALPLSQRCRRRMLRGPAETEEELERRADLMLAVDALVRRLRDRFYADSPASAAAPKAAIRA